MAGRGRRLPVVLMTMALIGAIVVVVVLTRPPTVPALDPAIVVLTPEAGADENALRSAADVLRHRIDPLGGERSDIEVRRGRIIVHVPPGLDRDKATRVLTTIGVLEFREVLERAAGPGGADVFEDPRLKRWYRLGPVLLNGAGVSDANPLRSDTSWTVQLVLTATGRPKFADITRRLAAAHHQLAIVVDGVVQFAPQVQMPIENGTASIAGNLSERAARELAIVLRSGRLPVRLSAPATG
jgi:preprotein translocase subunit SecD